MLSESELKSSFQSDEKIEEKSKQICKDLLNKKYDISALVEILGFALTSTNIELRKNGTKILSHTLMHLPSDYLTEFQLNFIITFYTDRLKDHHNLMPSTLDGLLAMVQMKNIPSASVKQFLGEFFAQNTCQSQVRGDRWKIFNIFKIISAKFKDILIPLGSEFVFGVINSIDGERDPRNLDFIFDFMPEFIENYPLLHLAEEMFEVFACYFPIDFNPSKTDPDSITRDKLAAKLINCLIASDSFIEWLVPLALEKLESDLIVAKLDAFDLLGKMARKFSHSTLQQYFEQIWINLKGEIFPGGDNQEMQAAGLKALRAFLEAASATDSNISKSYQTMVLATILTHLSDANHRLFLPARSIGLVCVTGDPVFAGDKILNTLLLKLQSEDCDKDQKIKILSTISQVFAICSAKNSLENLNAELKKNVEGELILIMESPNLSPESMEVLLNCLVEFIEQFSEKNRYKIYEFLKKIITNENQQHQNLERILKSFAKSFPTELENHLFDNLLKDFEKLSKVVKQKLYENLIILVEFSNFESITLNLIMSNCFESDKLAFAALKHLLEEQGQETKLIQLLYKKYELVDKIIDFVKKRQLETEILEQIATILNVFVRKLSVDSQKEVIDKYLPTMNLNLANDLFLTKGLLGFMHEDVKITNNFESIMNDLVGLSLNSSDEILRNACHHLICTLMNKADDTKSNNTVIKKILNKVKEEIKILNHRAVEILSWISKGLLVKGYADIGEIIEDIADLLDHPTLSHAAGMAFDIISIEYPGLHLPIVKFLFRQKFFHIVLNKFESHLLQFSQNHFNAFIHVLKMTPHKVLKLNIDKIGPVLFKCLEMKECNTIQISLEINKVFLKEQNEYFREHLGHLIPQFLKLADCKDSMNVRVSSLECLQVITKYAVYIILPYKMDVILSLTNILDDPKRLVRNTAVKTSNLWYLVGSPTE